MMYVSFHKMQCVCLNSDTDEQLAVPQVSFVGLFSRDIGLFSYDISLFSQNAARMSNFRHGPAAGCTAGLFCGSLFI